MGEEAAVSAVEKADQGIELGMVGWGSVDDSTPRLAPAA